MDKVINSEQGFSINVQKAIYTAETSITYKKIQELQCTKFIKVKEFKKKKNKGRVKGKSAKSEIGFFSHKKRQAFQLNFCFQFHTMLNNNNKYQSTMA